MGETAYTWIFLRGLTREKGHWGNFIERFKSAHPKDEVLAIDLPGSGDHLTQPSPTSINGIFNCVRAEAISKARAQSQFKLVALSLGGMVAMEWMKVKSDDLAGVVLINTSSRTLSPVYNRMRWQIWGDVVRLISVQTARERERGIIDIIMNSPEARETALPQWTKVAVDRPMSYKNFFNQLLAASRFEGLVIDPKLPTLILNSLGDRLVDPSCSTQLHEKFNWAIHRHPWAGHDLTWDDPQWVLDRIGEWN